MCADFIVYQCNCCTELFEEVDLQLSLLHTVGLFHYIAYRQLYKFYVYMYFFFSTNYTQKRKKCRDPECYSYKYSNNERNICAITKRTKTMSNSTCFVLLYGNSNNTQPYIVYDSETGTRYDAASMCVFAYPLEDQRAVRLHGNRRTDALRQEATPDETKVNENNNNKIYGLKFVKGIAK